MTWIQISHQNWNGFFSNISQQMMILQTSIVSWSKTKRNKHQTNKKIGFKWMATDLSNFNKQWSDAHFVSFLFYSYCTYSNCFGSLMISENIICLHPDKYHFIPLRCTIKWKKITWTVWKISATKYQFPTYQHSWVMFCKTLKTSKTQYICILG